MTKICTMSLEQLRIWIEKIVEAGKIDTPNIHIFTGPLSWFGSGTAIKSGGVELVWWGHASVFFLPFIEIYS